MQKKMNDLVILPRLYFQCVHAHKHKIAFLNQYTKHCISLNTQRDIEVPEKREDSFDHSKTPPIGTQTRTLTKWNTSDEKCLINLNSVCDRFLSQHSTDNWDERYYLCLPGTGPSRSMKSIVLQRKRSSPACPHLLALKRSILKRGHAHNTTT